MRFQLDIQSIVNEIKKLCFSCSASMGGCSHSGLVTNLGRMLRTLNCPVQHDYPVSFMHRTLKTGRVQRHWGYIDLFVDSEDHRIAVEFDGGRSLRYKSIEKLLQCDADVLVGIVGNGLLSLNIERVLEVMESSGIMNRKVLLIAVSEKDSEEISW